MGLWTIVCDGASSIELAERFPSTIGEAPSSVFITARAIK